LWYNDYEAISLDKALRNYKAAISAYIFLDSEDNNGCVTTDSVFIKIKPYSYQLVLPNIFSPDDNGINDYFNFYADGALQKVNIFLVFDRWGNLVYKAENVLNFEVFVGWDGKFNGKKALPGVYTYLIEAEFIDGYKSKFAGDITIIR
jgi:gliding motility-associated-like protein